MAEPLMTLTKPGGGNCPACCSLLAVAHGAIGCGVGLLLAGRLGCRAQRATATALLVLGAIATVPVVYGVLAKQLNRPESERGMKRRLASIRGGQGGGWGGLAEEVEEF